MYKLQKIKRKNLDVEKYSKTLNESLNYKLYAEVWYLDIVTHGKWECLVFGDYEVIMPIPLQFKFGIKFVIMPIYCQQLGVFYKEEISDDLFKAFEKKLHKYRVRSYSFNEENTERYNPQGEKRVNHVLELNRSYEEIRNNYNRNRRRKLKTLPDNFQILDSKEYSLFFNLRKMHYPELDKKINNVILNKIFESCSSKKYMILKKIIDEDSDLQALVFYMISKKRLIQLAAVRDKSIKDVGFFTLILDKVIQENSDSNKSIDFGGSMMNGVALYNESFGAIKNFYTFFSNFKI